MAGPRRRSREIALQVLYQLDVNPEMEPGAALDAYLRHMRDAGAAEAGSVEEGEAEEGGAGGEEGAGADDRELTRALVAGVVAHRAEIDELLSRVSRAWRVERMAQVDRNVMRLAVFELKYRTDIPAAVTFNEAIELAKRFGTAEAGAFVNGLLERAAAELGSAG